MVMMFLLLLVILYPTSISLCDCLQIVHSLNCAAPASVQRGTTLLSEVCGSSPSVLTYSDPRFGAEMPDRELKLHLSSLGPVLGINHLDGVIPHVEVIWSQRLTNDPEVNSTIPIPGDVSLSMETCGNYFLIATITEQNIGSNFTTSSHAPILVPCDGEFGADLALMAEGGGDKSIIWNSQGKIISNGGIIVNIKNVGTAAIQPRNLLESPVIISTVVEANFLNGTDVLGMGNQSLQKMFVQNADTTIWSAGYWLNGGGEALIESSGDKTVGLGPGEEKEVDLRKLQMTGRMLRSLCIREGSFFALILRIDATGRFSDMNDTNNVLALPSKVICDAKVSMHRMNKEEDCEIIPGFNNDGKTALIFRRKDPDSYIIDSELRSFEKVPTRQMFKRYLEHLEVLQRSNLLKNRDLCPNPPIDDNPVQERDFSLLKNFNILMKDILESLNEIEPQGQASRDDKVLLVTFFKLLDDASEEFLRNVSEEYRQFFVQVLRSLVKKIDRRIRRQINPSNGRNRKKKNKGRSKNNRDDLDGPSSQKSCASENEKLKAIYYKIMSLDNIAHPDLLKFIPRNVLEDFRALVEACEEPKQSVTFIDLWVNFFMTSPEALNEFQEMIGDADLTLRTSVDAMTRQLDQVLDFIKTDLVPEVASLYPDASSRERLNFSVALLDIIEENAESIIEVGKQVLHLENSRTHQWTLLTARPGREVTLDTNCYRAASQYVAAGRQIDEEESEMDPFSDFMTTKFLQGHRTPTRWLKYKNGIFSGKRSVVFATMFWDELAMCSCPNGTQNESSKQPARGRRDYQSTSAALVEGFGLPEIPDDEETIATLPDDDLPSNDLGSMFREIIFPGSFPARFLKRADALRRLDPSNGTLVRLVPLNRTKGEDEDMTIVGLVIVEKLGSHDRRRKTLATVCDDGWGPEEAWVACKLGTHRLTGSKFELEEAIPRMGDSSQKEYFEMYEAFFPAIQIAHVDCPENATSLDDCSYDGWHSQECLPFQRAQVECRLTKKDA